VSYKRYLAGMTKPALKFQVKDVLSWTDTASIPLFPSDESPPVFAQIRKAPRLDVNDLNWRARPHRELDATNDRSIMHFTATPAEGSWPIYKGESFDIWEADKGSYYGWADPRVVLAQLQVRR